MKKPLLLLMLLSFIFSSCSKLEDAVNSNLNPSASPKDVAKVDIQNAKILFISSGEASPKLYAVVGDSSNGGEKTVEVVFLNNNGDTIKGMNTASVTILKKYIILNLWNHFGVSDFYFVDRTDGSAFKTPSDFDPYISGNIYHPSLLFPLNMGNIQEDKFGDIYFSRCPDFSPYKSTLHKMSILSPSSFMFEDLSVANDFLTGFCTDNIGNALYNYKSENLTEGKLRYRYADGGYANVSMSSETTELIFVWKGTDGEMYCIMMDRSAALQFYLVKITEEGTTVEKNINVEIENYNCSNCSYENYFHQVQGQIIFSQSGEILNLSSAEAYKASPCSVRANMVSNDKLFYFDKTTLQFTLIDIETGATSLYYDLDEFAVLNYEIDKILSVKEDGILFSGLDLHTGKNVTARLNIHGIVTVVNKEIPGTVSNVYLLN